MGARYEKDACRYHGCRVNERGHRRRALHRVRQPRVQRHLAGLAHRADQQQQRGRGRNGQSADGGGTGKRCQRAGFKQAVAAIEEQQGAGLLVEPDHAEEERHIPHPRGNEGLLRGRCRRRFLIVKADQQIGREAHAFPCHEQQQQAVGITHQQHRPAKQREEPEESPVALFLRHVASAVDEDPQRHKGDHRPHAGTQRVEQKADFQSDIAILKPYERRRNPHSARCQHAGQGSQGDQAGNSQRANRQFRCNPALGIRQKRDDATGQQREQRHAPKQQMEVFSHGANPVC